MSDDLEPRPRSVDVQSLPKLPKDPDFLLGRAFKEYIAPYWRGEVTCPVCRQTAWSILAATDPPLRYTPGYVLTLIPVQCDTCKYVMFFNGTAAGLFDESGLPVTDSHGE
jgi:hypothetical protein